jgi:hypothetical protein
VTSHPESSNSSAAKCGSCHQENFCIDCHGYKMPHPARFTSEHSQIVEKDGEAGCRRCHAENDCVDCHVRHVHPTTSEQMDLLGITRPKGGGQ